MQTLEKSSPSHAVAKEQERSSSQLTDRLFAVADPTRRLILSLLARSGETQSVKDLASAMGGLRQSGISYHLGILRKAGLIQLARKEWLHSYYRLCPDGVRSIVTAMEALVRQE